MATNQHASSLSAVQSAVSGVSTNIISLESQISGIPGGAQTSYVTNRASSKTATPVLLLSITSSSFLQLLHFNDAASSGSTLQIYLGPDNTYPLFQQCTLAGGACSSPIPSPLFSPTGWSVYGTNDGTNYTHIGYSYYSGYGNDSTIVTDCLDTYLAGLSQDSNYGTQTSFKYGWVNATNRHRALLRFDLSALPAGITVANATLSLNCTSILGALDNMAVYACLKPWVYNQATWNIYSTGNPWETPGALGSTDIRSPAEWTGNPALVEDERYNWNVTALVREWVYGTLTNNGFLLGGTHAIANYTQTFGSREHATESRRPQLLITYS